MSAASRQMEAGCISVHEDLISYESPNGDSWQIGISDVALIGEYVDPGGFPLEDYFVIFVDSPDAGFIAPMYAGGIDEALKLIEQRLGVSLPFAFAGRVDRASRVVWPPRLLGRPLFGYKKMRIAPGKWWNLFRFWRILWPMIECRFTEEVVSFVSSWERELQQPGTTGNEGDDQPRPIHTGDLPRL